MEDRISDEMVPMRRVTGISEFFVHWVLSTSSERRGDFKAFWYISNERNKSDFRATFARSSVKGAWKWLTMESTSGGTDRETSMSWIITIE